MARSIWGPVAALTVTLALGIAIGRFSVATKHLPLSSATSLVRIPTNKLNEFTQLQVNAIKASKQLAGFAQSLQLAMTAGSSTAAENSVATTEPKPTVKPVPVAKTAYAASTESHSFDTSGDWIARLQGNTCRWRVHSQTKQDGLLWCIFEAVGTTNQFFVEFGFQGPQGANTEYLKVNGWTGLRMDIRRQVAAELCHREKISSVNIGSLFEKYNVPKQPDYVSIDIDSCDLWVMRALFNAGWSPRVLTIEYNSAHMINSTLTAPDHATVRWAGTHYYGTSLGAIHLVAEEYGYGIVTIDPKTDAFLVRKDIVGSGKVPAFASWDSPSYILRFHGPQSNTQTSNWVDYKKWRAVHKKTDTSFAEEDDWDYAPQAEVHKVMLPKSYKV
eukprot:TRINITY_DN103474_c0_g1_i1.p1 TRINITY_DN103474_c0_g1~~TRINITY_DN103474_c0_g1_i1.p1  ORF type:complete len:387 (+),score=29.47 TRINITY_DN103474_c0_g1_i1:32-1192(+)